MKKALIAGASGMVGSLISRISLASPEISEVTSLVRRMTDSEHPGLTEIIVNDFKDYSQQQESFQDIDIGFFCIGVYTGQVPDDEFKKITIDYAVAFAEALKENSPNATLCFLSGAGADRTEKSRMSFARYKGIAENQIADLGLNGFYTFKPGYIYPVEPRKEPSLTYKLMRSLFPLIRLAGKGASIKSTELAEAMVHVGLNGADHQVLENDAIVDIYLQYQ